MFAKDRARIIAALQASEMVMTEIAAWPSAGEGYRLLLVHIGQFFRFSAGWIACLLGCAMVKMLPLPSLVLSLVDIATLATAAVAAASFSVSWYRAILEDESLPGRVPLTLGLRELRFLGHQTAIMLVPGLPVVMLVLLLSAHGWWATAFAVFHGGGMPEPLTLLRLVGGLAVLTPMSVAALLITPRLMLVLPLVATDEPGPLLAPVWQLSRGNTTALFKGWLGCILPASALWALTWFELAGALGPLAMPLVEAAGDFLFFVALAVSTGFFAFGYAQLAEGGTARPSAPPFAAPAE